MYDKIKNPITGRMIKINSKLGNEILNKYINMIGGLIPTLIKNGAVILVS